jgi:hypothetical protein
MRKILCAIFTCLLAGAVQAALVYQDIFDNDGLNTNTNAGGAASSITLDGTASWSDNGNATYSNGGTAWTYAALLYSDSSFQSDGGFELAVTYYAESIASSGRNILSFGLLESASTYSVNSNPFVQSNAGSTRGIGANVILHSTSSQTRGLWVADGDGAHTLLDASGTSQQFIAGTATPVIMSVTPDGTGGADWSYSINGVEEATGNIASFDFTKSYHFVAYGQDNEHDKRIDKVELSTFESEGPVAFAQNVRAYPDLPLDITLTGSGSNLTYTVSSMPTLGTLVGATNQWTYTATNGYDAADSFSFYVSDGALTSETAQVSITVASNAIPEAVSQAVETLSDSDLDITLSGTDTDGPSNLTYTVVLSPTNGTLSGTAPNLTYTPTNGVGSDRITFTVNDGMDDSEEGTILITVNNAPPVADSKMTWAQPDTAVSILLTGSDPDSGPSNLTFSVATQPANGFLSGTEPNLTYTPTNGFTGEDRFTYIASDGAAVSDSATVSITVEQNSLTLSFDALNKALSGNTLNIGGNKDAMAVAGVAASNNYLYSVAYTGVDIDGDATNDTVSFDVLVEAWDGGDISTTFTGGDVDVYADKGSAVIGTNDVAVTIGAEGWSVGGTTMDAGETLSYTLQNVSVSASSGGSYSAALFEFTGIFLDELAGYGHQTVVGEGDGLFASRWNASTQNFAGLLDEQNPLLISSCGPDGLPSSSEQSWQVQDVDFDLVVWDDSVNQVPVADGQSVVAALNTALDITLTGRDLDVGPDSLTYNVVDSPTNGVLTGTAPNLIYTPTEGYIGEDRLTFTVSDGATNSALATVSITVENTRPVADAQSVSTQVDTAVDITLIGSDVDGPDDLTYTVVSMPVYGVLVTNGALPNLTYTPTNGYEGADSFTFEVNDGLASSVAATVSITVGNQLPTATAQSISTPYETVLDITLAGSDTDGPSNLTYTVVSQPVNGVLTTNGALPNLTYTPGSEYQGADSFTFIVNDGMDDSTAATISITVEEPTAVEDPVISPSLSGSSLSLSWDGGGSYNVLTNADLLNSGGWGVATNGTSPIEIEIGSDSELFYKLSQ